MEIFCVFPFMVDFMMRSGSFDDAGHVHTFGLPPIVSDMVVSMQFDECNAEDEDGEEATICFNKKERFKCTDALFGYTLWEMVQNFGYAQKDDGTYEVYHYGQMWRGPFFIRLIFQMHARYVIFATEQHLNSERFVGKEETSDEEIAQRHNIPAHLFGHFLSDLQVDVQAKLGESQAALTALNLNGGGSKEKDAAVEALLAKVASLEGSLAKLEAARVRRANTAAEGGSTFAARRYNTDAGPRRKATGSVRGMRERALQRRETAAEGADDADDIADAIKVAIAHVEPAKPAFAAIQRRVTKAEEALDDGAPAAAAPPAAAPEPVHAPVFSTIVPDDSGEDSAADADDEPVAVAVAPVAVAVAPVVAEPAAPEPAKAAPSSLVAVAEPSMPITYAPQAYPYPAPQPVEVHVHIHRD